MVARHLIHVLMSATLSSPVIVWAQTGENNASQSEPSASPKPQPKQAARSRERRIYGSQLMTPEERTAYQEKMRSAKTPEEQEQIRATHHREMQARAKERGITLPEEPPPRARQGRDMGPVPGMGPEAGMGGR